VPTVVVFGFGSEMIRVNLSKAFSSFQGVPLVVLRRLLIVAFLFLKFYFKIVSEASLPL
jgi:hypothetical protein